MEFRIILSAALMSTLFGLSACGGGGSGGGSASFDEEAHYAKAKLADEFVRRAYGDADLDLRVVNAYSLKDGFVVVSNRKSKDIEAYYLGDYKFGQDVGAYLASSNVPVYRGLVQTRNSFRDPVSGIVFKETSASTKDLGKLAALKQSAKIKYAADKIQAEFGLSESRSFAVAKLAVYSNSKTMSDKQIEGLSTFLTGASVKETARALRSAREGDSSVYHQLVEKAAVINGVGPEHMNQILESLFN